MTTKKQHHVVGWRFNSLGDIYQCIRWQRGNGYWMRLIEKNDSEWSWPASRLLGHEIAVSECAIGLAYHRLPKRRNKYESHDQPCDCYVCKKRKEEE